MQTPLSFSPTILLSTAGITPKEGKAENKRLDQCSANKIYGKGKWIRFEGDPFWLLQDCDRAAQKLDANSS